MTGLAGLASAATLLSIQPANAQPASARPVSAQPAATRATASGSIVYIKKGEVWIAHANGSHARQFTKHKYNWFSPSEANNGTIVVAGGLARTNPGGTDSSGESEIYKFRPNGNQIGKPIPTWGSYSSPACPSYGPTSVEVSPDATKIAYGIWSCGGTSFTALWTPANATKLDFPHQKVGQMGFYEPHWVNNSTFLVSSVGPPLTSARWYIHGVNQADNTGYKGWNVSSMTGTGAQAIINRQGSMLAIFEDDAANWTDGKPRHVNLWIWTGAHIPDNWTKRCVISLPAARFPEPMYLSPSFSPNGKELVWDDTHGIEEASVANPGDCSTIKPHLLIPGGTQPYFSSAAEQRGAASPHQPG